MWQNGLCVHDRVCIPGDYKDGGVKMHEYCVYVHAHMCGFTYRCQLPAMLLDPMNDCNQNSTIIKFHFQVMLKKYFALNKLKQMQKLNMK